MTALDPAKRDLAVLAVTRARRRIDLVRSVIGRRVAHDIGARQLGTVLSIVTPMLEAIETLIPEPTK
jgi:hypothetical protein